MIETTDPAAKTSHDMVIARTFFSYRSVRIHNREHEVVIHRFQKRYVEWVFSCLSI